MRRFVCAVLLVAMFLPGAAAAQTSTARPAPEIVIRPGDVVRIAIWREPDLSGDFPVDEQGAVILPLLGSQTVGGLSIDRIREMLIEKYREQLRNPAITVTPLRRVNLLGEVREPGLYPIDATVTLAGAVALAGGSTPAGDLNRIQIVRDGQVLPMSVGLTQTLGTADIRSGDQIIVGRRSWFDRNSPFLVSALLSVASIVASIIRN